MNSLSDVLAGYRQGGVGLEQLVGALQTAHQGLTEHQKDISGLLKDLPEYMVGVERASWLGVSSEIGRLLTEARENIRDPAKIEALQQLPKLFEELTGHSLALRECAWVARGPTVHGGVNELLHLLERLEVESDEESLALLRARLDVEYVRLENQYSMLEQLPEFMQHAMRELLPEYQQLLQAAESFLELEETEAEELLGQLEDWGAGFGSYDLDFAMKRYSQVPTPIPSLNLALNTQLLYLDEVVVPEMVDHAVTLALDTLESAGEEFLKTPNLSEVARHEYQELLDAMIELLEGLPEIEDRELLKVEGGKLVQLAGRFVSVQSHNEGDSGSRLDYKTE